ncbi:hypothetical protein J3459_018114 [Metarhizium acridum]|nr:hypothetical protein J3459_018206 [Metarhizium acridum]KAG8408152.1 hypothetical protein J3459_018114 [Metarhizium acridum]
MTLLGGHIGALTRGGGFHGGKKINEDPPVWQQSGGAQLEWHTYLTKNFPKTLHSWDGTVLNFEATVEEETVAQTGQKPERRHVSQKPNDGDPTKATLH